MTATEATMKLLAVAVTAILSVSLGRPADLEKRDVDIKAPDGTNLKASYFSVGRPGPAMILLHQCNMDRHAWDGLAKDLAEAGFHVLTVDFRGYGESGGGRPTDAAERQSLLVAMAADILAAMRQQTAAAAYRRAYRRLQRSKSNGGCHSSATQSFEDSPRRRGLVRAPRAAADSRNAARGEVGNRRFGPAPAARLRRRFGVAGNAGLR